MSRHRHRIQIGAKRIWKQMCRKRKTFVQHLAEVELLLKRRSIKGGEDKVAAVDRAPVAKVLVHVMDLSDQVLQDYQCKSWQEPQL